MKKLNGSRSTSPDPKMHYLDLSRTPSFRNPLHPLTPTSAPTTQRLLRTPTSEEHISNMLKTLNSMWPEGEWCPEHYYPLTLSRGILSPMQSLTRLWAREGKDLKSLWNEIGEPGLLVEIIHARSRGPWRLSAPSASEALRRAKLIVCTWVLAIVISCLILMRPRLFRSRKKLESKLLPCR